MTLWLFFYSILTIFVATVLLAHTPYTFFTRAFDGVLKIVFRFLFFTLCIFSFFLYFKFLFEPPNVSLSDYLTNQFSWENFYKLSAVSLFALVLDRFSALPDGLLTKYKRFVRKLLMKYEKTVPLGLSLWNLSANGRNGYILPIGDLDDFIENMYKTASGEIVLINPHRELLVGDQVSKSWKAIRNAIEENAKNISAIYILFSKQGHDERIEQIISGSAHTLSSLGDKIKVGAIDENENIGSFSGALYFREHPKGKSKTPRLRYLLYRPESFLYHQTGVIFVHEEKHLHVLSEGESNNSINEKKKVLTAIVNKKFNSNL